MATPRDLENLRAVLADLLRVSDPVSFHDALMLVRQLRRCPELPDPLVRGLVQLHDAAHTTHGARDILAEFLRGLASRQARELALGRRIIELKDSGKTARLAAGERLQIRLEEKRGAGFRWTVVATRGIGRVSRSPDDHAATPTAVFEITIRRRGQFELVLEERPPPGALAEAHASLRRFELTVLAER